MLKRRLLIATSNPGKYREIMEVMHDLPCEIYSSLDLKLNNEIEEDGITYEDNAIKKARHYLAQVGDNSQIVTSEVAGCQGRGIDFVLAEDSGIVVDTLSGDLGVKTRRWGAGKKASDEEWIEYFLKTLAGVPDEKRTARFVCFAVVMNSSGGIEVFEGVTEGLITRDLEAPLYKGLPISSCFRPEGFSKVYAALTVEEKNQVSHRGKAMHAVKAYLQKLV
jgi:XTP/dITP diphosphohydrolase